MQNSLISFRFISNSLYRQNIFIHSNNISHLFNIKEQLIPNLLHQQYRKVSQSTYSSYFSIDFVPIKCAYTVLDSVHTHTGLPWWATILITTFTLRTFITLPIFVLATKNSIKLEKLRPQIVQMSNDLKKEISRAQKESKWTQKIAYGQYKINMKRLVKKVYINNNCHPAKNIILPWMQIPIWVSLSMALRNMSGSFNQNISALSPDLSIEGVLWFTNMLIPDTPLSLIFFLTNFIIIELHNKKMPKKTRIFKFITNFSRVVNVIMLPIAMSMPCCLSLYWTCSSFYGLLQNIIVNQAFKKARTPQQKHFK